ncbi:MAG TPA: glycosyltransferase family 9 protein [Nevskia sp.]|nr:glycosyltransferase family 9 protein [Nevskia sp.]
MKILFFSHDGKLGDAVVNTAFVDGVKQLDPGAELHALVSDVTENFWQMDRRVARVWRYKNPPLGEALRTSLALRRERFDYVVTWKERFSSEKTRLMLWLAAPTRGTLYEEGRLPGRTAHAIRKSSESLRLIYGARVDGIKVRYRLGLDLDPPSSFDAELPPQRPAILFNMFSAEPPKTIDVEHGARVLAGLAALAPQASLCLSCTDATEDAARRAIAASGTAGKTVNTEKNLRRLISLCARASLVVSTDTSLIHIASALDRPVLGIYFNDPVKSVEWAPLATHCAAVISRNRDTVNGFSLDEVLEKARGLLAQVPGVA